VNATKVGDTKQSLYLLQKSDSVGPILCRSGGLAWVPFTMSWDICYEAFITSKGIEIWNEF